MFFNKKDKRKKSGGGIIRLFLSLIIIAVLGVGMLQAYRSFSGIDPLSLSPEMGFKSLLSSEGLVRFITGVLTLSPSQSLNKAKEILGEGASKKSDANQSTNSSNPSVLKFKFAVVADSHTDYSNLKKALAQAKNSGAQFVIGIGDFSDVGTIEELSNTKQQFDTIGLPYYLTPGDHDLWDARNKKIAPEQNFRDVFGINPFQSFSYENTRFLIVYNSDNYLGLDDYQLKWIEDELDRVVLNSPQLILAFVDIPLYHPSSDHIMGKTTSKLKNQADHLISTFKKKNVQEVIAADAHLFSRYQDPLENLKMTTVGAVTSAKNTQAPRYVIVDVFEDGSYNIQDVEIH